MKKVCGTKSVADSGWLRASTMYGELNARVASDTTPRKSAPTRGKNRISTSPMAKGAAMATRNPSTSPPSAIRITNDPIVTPAAIACSRRHRNPPGRSSKVVVPTSAEGAGGEALKLSLMASPIPKVACISGYLRV